MSLINYRRSHIRTLMYIAESVRVDTQNTASLCSLPAELIRDICDYLPIAEIFCLIITCSHFWNSRNSIPAFAKVQRLVHAPRLKQPYRYDLVEARFHILRLMEFDKIYGKGTRSFCCWTCMSTHEKLQFSSPKRRVNLKLSVEEQRVNWSAASRCCKIRRRRFWVGMCYEMSFAEFRDLQLCENKAGSTIKIAAGGCFSERVEFNLEIGCLLSWFYLGRLSDLGLRGFDKLCKRACIPICLHKTTRVLGSTFRLGGMHPRTMYHCRDCPTHYFVTITPSGFIELHISRYVGFLTSGASLSSWRRMSYFGTNSCLTYHYQEFSDWLDRMYNPETGAVFNGGKFEMFKRGRKPKSNRN